MGYFPMCISLKDTYVILVGEGNAATEKLNILQSFGADIKFFSKNLSEKDLDPRPAFVVVADVDYSEKERISTLCQGKYIPVNVVDVPALCTFFFPAMLQKGDLTISVSTGGKSPGAASYLRKQLESQIPDQTDVILDWLGEIRCTLSQDFVPGQRRQILKHLTETAFQKNRPLTLEEMQRIKNKVTAKFDS